MEILSLNRHKLDSLASALLVHETLENGQIDKIIASSNPESETPLPDAQAA
jgi:ATP-dependent Zn protease